MFKKLIKEVQAVIELGHYAETHIFKLEGCTYRIKHENLEAFVKRLKSPLRKPTLAKIKQVNYNVKS